MIPPLLSIVATLLAAAALAGSPRAQDCGRGRGSRVASDDGGGRSVMRIADASGCLEIRTDGDVDFTDDDGDVARLSPGGTLAVSETRGATTRRMEIVERAGRLERAYWVNGERRPPEAGAGWLRAVLPAVAREHLAGADRRAARVLRAGGARGLLDEVARIGSDAVKRVYLLTLADAPRQPPAVLRDAARTAGDHVASDAAKADVLRRIVARASGDRSVLGAVVGASGRIASDDERARVLLDAVAATADAGVHAAAAGAARQMASDARRGDVLAALAARGSGSDAVWDAVFRAADAMASDTERARVLVAVAHRPGVGAAAAAGAVRSASRMASDAAKATALIELASRTPVLRDAATRSTFFDALRTMSSSGEYRRVIEAVIR